MIVERGTAKVDVPFVPIPEEAIEGVLELAEVGPGDRAIDIGCGDGRVLLACARRGAEALGLERDKERLAVAREAAREAADAAAYGGRARFLEGDFEDPAALEALELGRATVVYFFLLPWALDLLFPQVYAALPAGARIVTYAFLPDPEACPAPERSVEAPSFSFLGPTPSLHLWRIPSAESPDGDVRD